MDIKEALLNLGYSNITEDSQNYRMKPIYRESSSNTVLSVRKDTGYFIDFSRGIKGNFRELVRLSLKLENPEDAEKWLSSKSFHNDRTIKTDRPKVEQPKIFNKDCLRKLRSDHSYWINRGISKGTIETFRGGVINEGKMKNRYVFPIFNSRKELIGVSGRYIHEMSPSSSIPKWKHLGTKSEWKYPMQINHKICNEEKKVILVESIGDMLALWDADIKNTIVTFGLEISPAVLSYMIRIDVDEIFIAFNNDEGKNSAGNIAASKAVNKLSRYFDEEQVVVAIPDQQLTDFGDMKREEILSWKQKYYLHQG